MSLKQMLLRAFYAVCRLLPLSRRTVLLFSYYGEQYGGSPKYIGEYLAANSRARVVWAFVSPGSHPECAARKVRYGRFGYYHALATAGAVITNYRMTDEFRKRRGQKYLQTWHSSLRMKMIEKDAEETLPENYVRMAKKDSPQIDWLLAGSRKSEEIFRRAFWYDGRIAATGTPQCDILFSRTEEIRRKVCDRFGLDGSEKIVLYAPTFRRTDDLSVYLKEFDEVLTAFRSRFGGRWAVLVRLHPHLVLAADGMRFGNGVYNATRYEDAQELLAAADALISDYSAIVFDYALTRRPCFLYVPDISAYTAGDRGLYFLPEELPFPGATTPEALCGKIGSFDENEYLASVENFLKAIGSYEDGKACGRVQALLEEGGLSL